MKRLNLSTVFVVSLLLSQQAQCAEAESAKGPLTAAEIAQCEAQRIEFNQGVETYKTKVGEIKALEDEIDTTSAALEKEAAAVNRRDNAAMDDLNAKIGRHNEEIKRHELMISVANAMGGENKQRIAQYRENCENRPLAPPPSTPKRSVPLPTLPSESACSSAVGAKGVERKIEATFDEMRVDEKKRQAEVESVANARAKAQGWTKEQRSKVWLQILGSPKFAAFEREKKPYVLELMSILSNRPKNAREECLLVQRIASTLPAIKAINARQYAFMADEIRVAK